MLDAGDHAELFDPFVRKYLVGVTALAVPLLPADGEMIGLVVLYRKGEQPITEEDVAMAEMISVFKDIPTWMMYRMSTSCAANVSVRHG